MLCPITFHFSDVRICHFKYGGRQYKYTYNSFCVRLIEPDFVHASIWVHCVLVRTYKHIYPVDVTVYLDLIIYFTLIKKTLVWMFVVTVSRNQIIIMLFIKPSIFVIFVRLEAHQTQNC